MSAARVAALLIGAAGCLETPQMLDPDPVVMRTYQGDLQAPLAFVAAQAGDGTWTRVDSEDGVYQFPSDDGRYGVAVVCAEGGQSAVSFLYATTAEYPEITRGCPSDGGQDGQLDVQVNTLDDDDIGAVSCLSQAGEVVIEASSATFVGLLPGTYDLFLTVRSTGADIDGLVVSRGVEVPAVTTAVLDRASAVTPSPFSLAVAGALEDEEVTSEVLFLTTRGTQALLVLGYEAAAYAGLPQGEIADDELYLARAFARQEAVGTFRDHWRFFHQGQNLTLSLPPPILASATAIETEPYVRVALTVDSSGAALYHAVVYQGLVDRLIGWDATAGWLADLDETAWQQPDLSHLEGWENGWALVDNVETSYVVTEVTGDAPDPLLPFGSYPASAPLLPSDARDQTSLASSTVQGSFTP